MPKKHLVVVLHGFMGWDRNVAMLASDSQAKQWLSRNANNEDEETIKIMSQPFKIKTLMPIITM